jgi:hypothetical protein
MKKILRIPILTTALLLLTAGSALAMFLNVAPSPVSEPGTMLLFGSSLTFISITGQKNYRKALRDQQEEEQDDLSSI